jgi:hypothetical protein
MRKSAKNMNHKPAQTIFMGDTPQKHSPLDVQGEYVHMLGEHYYKIQHFDALDPFFVSLVSSSDHWLFIASSGGLSAGRVSAEQALFPYYTEDKLTENSENTGSKTILRVNYNERTWLWEPFSIRQQGQYHLERNLYKNLVGTCLVFEEENKSLGLTYRYAWRTSELFGFVKTAWLLNGNEFDCRVDLVDGLQNILPANVAPFTQNNLSCLLDAYKRNELQLDTGLAIFALNASLTDLAEPSESLLATTAFQLGLDPSEYLLSSTQLDLFRHGYDINMETEIRGRRGAYFVHTCLDLSPKEMRTWHLVMDVNQDHPKIVHRLNQLRGDQSALRKKIEADIKVNSENLQQIIGSADGLQVSADTLCTAHHLSNVLFNVMRGGVFADQYWIDKADFFEFVAAHNRLVGKAEKGFFNLLPARIDVSELHSRAESYGSADLIRLSYTYLPLTFSRRHGDPSRPWNRFAINLKKSDGTQKLDYEGNWRDIFQNWEALAYAYPEYVEGMIYVFLNATTADGYNPYRITRAGIDWEIPEPGNPWANIGYWSDHQIIYLLKLMEISARIHPGKLGANLNRPIFSYANVPYQIKPYSALQNDPYNTIHFNDILEQTIEKRVTEVGTDGKLVYDQDGQVLHRSLAEKLLTLLLAKLVNFVPEGGVWMNTQRPEWNDANNALVGKGLSVVTLGYLRRYLTFCQDLFRQQNLADIQVSTEVMDLFTEIARILMSFKDRLNATFSEKERLAMMDALGQAGSDYRWQYYQHGFSGELSQISTKNLLAFFELVQAYVDHSLRANKRKDNLYHAYNVLHRGDAGAAIRHLYEMLEGQVSILSSGILSGEESLNLLQNLRNSSLYREDQHSYILYPDKDLPGFLERNSLPEEHVQHISLVAELVKAEDKTLLVRDMQGTYHFSGHIRNVNDVNRALERLQRQPRFAAMVQAESEKIKTLYESVFHHSEFTGRSGTFFAYEGLGSIYWHMVSKLLLAVQETLVRCKDEPSMPGLLAKYADIRAGLGYNTSPAVFGAFPTDPYSHTPKGQGAKQPGMTGAVKEEILTRQAELGFFIKKGCLYFDNLLLNQSELLSEPASYIFYDVEGRLQQIELAAGTLAYSICQVPVILQTSNQAYIEVQPVNGVSQRIDGLVLDHENSVHIFKRDGIVQHLTVNFQA